MLIRYPVEGNMDWCCRSHIATPITIGQDTSMWTRCGVYSKHLPDDEILDLLSVPDELNDVTELVVGDPSRGVPSGNSVKVTIKGSYSKEKRREYNREYRLKRKGGE